MTALFKYRPTNTTTMIGNQLILFRRIKLLQKKKLKTFKKTVVELTGC